MEQQQEKPIVISNREYFQIAEHLDNAHVIFRKFYEMGRPIFDDKISSACIRFDKKTFAPTFVFSPVLWSRLDDYTRAFIVAHEMLYIILEHGKRLRDLTHGQADYGNIATDLVVNHLLVEKFGFDRKRLRLPEDTFKSVDDLCWIDTIFAEWAEKDHNSQKVEIKRDNDKIWININREKFKGRVHTDESVETYFNILKALSPKSRSFDEHIFVGEGEFDDVLRDLNDDMQHVTPEEQKVLQEILEEHGDNSTQGGKGKGRGRGAGDLWSFIDTIGVKPKTKWEKVIKKWVAPFLVERAVERERWGIPHRRTALLRSNGLFLPVYADADEHIIDDDKIEVFFFLDTSGSCWQLKNRFFRAAKSLPSDTFNVRAFVFDDVVTEIKLSDNKVRGGGGTRFDIIECKILEICQKEGIDYPRAVWVMTDGFGNKVTPQKPENWYFFLSNNYKYYIPAGAKTFMLSEFE